MSFLRLLNTYSAPLIEPNLHVLAVISNPCLYRRRYQLAREFFDRMNRTPHVILYVVELAYGDQPFAVTQAGNPRHLQLRTTVPLWHKENMINLGVRTLLPRNWKAFAWIDADVEFENPQWAVETLRVLSGADIVQPFAESVHLDANSRPTNTTHVSICCLVKHKQSIFWGNCGYAWAMTRSAYERVGGLYERAIMGGGDAIMSKAFTKQGSINRIHELSSGFQASMRQYDARAGRMKVGYVPGKVFHYFHGTLQNRKYMERWETLVKYAYNPATHLTLDARGLLVPTPECPRDLLADIMTYFLERNEDESTYARPEAAPQCAADERTPTASSQCSDSQSPAEAPAPQCETTRDTENCVVPDCDAASVGTPDSKNERATPEERECERAPETEQMSSTA